MRGQVLGLLSGLVAKSLVVADTSGDGARYRLLETVRHYAADGLADEEAVGLGERHATWCLELTVQALLFGVRSTARISVPRSARLGLPDHPATLLRDPTLMAGSGATGVTYRAALS